MAIISSIVIGAAIFQVFSIVDGCDGEIARARDLESKFGERLDSFCDFLASVLYVLALGWGLDRSGEGIVCAALITTNELLLRYSSGGIRLIRLHWISPFMKDTTE